MRTPRNETDGLTDDETRSAADGPVRRCILSGNRESRGELLRLALGPDGQVHPDVRARAPGRGAWIGVARPELEQALARGRLRGALARAFKRDVAVVPDLPQRIADALERHALDRLGLEAKAGNLLTGSDRIETAARNGRLAALYHAADASDDGMRRLAQAWRVGSDREGTDLKGLVLPLSRPILSLALGRENVVHLGLTDLAAAKRVSDALGRWLRFNGHQMTSTPCGTAPQGASALPGGVAPAAAIN